MWHSCGMHATWMLSQHCGITWVWTRIYSLFPKAHVLYHQISEELRHYKPNNVVPCHLCIMSMRRQQWTNVCMHFLGQSSMTSKNNKGKEGILWSQNFCCWLSWLCSDIIMVVRDFLALLWIISHSYIHSEYSWVVKNKCTKHNTVSKLTLRTYSTTNCSQSSIDQQPIIL